MNKIKASILLLGGVLVSPAVLSQVTDSSELSKKDAKNSPLEVIVVTARKREESVIDVPFAVDVYGKNILENNRISASMSFYRNVPGLSFSSSDDGFFNHFQMRGVGPLSQALSPDDSSIVTYIDGVPLSAYASDISYIGLDRIEVLRGPQGTLFGRSAQAGVINLITRKPDENYTEFAVEAGSNGHSTITGDWSSVSADGQLGGGLVVRGAWRDGHVPNRAPEGGMMGEFRDISGRASGLMRWGDDNDSSVNLQFNWDRRNGKPAYNILKADEIQVDITPEHESSRDAWSANLITEVPMDNIVFNGVLSFSGWDTRLLLDDSDGFVFGHLFGDSPLRFRPALDISDWRESEKRHYLEARIQNQNTDHLSWVAGYSHMGSDYTIDLRNLSSYSPMIAGLRTGDQEIKSDALFGETTFSIAQNLDFTIGARHTRDRKEASALYRNNGGSFTVPSFAENHKMQYKLTTGRTALSWKLDSNSSLYATVARGSKSGGFPRFTMNAAFGNPTSPYAPSKSWSYEVGYKKAFSNGKVSVAGFYNDIVDEQLMTFDFVTFQFFPTNLDTTSSGLEFSGNWLFSRKFRIDLAMNLTKAELESVGISGAKVGNRVPNVPRGSSSLQLDYEGSSRALSGRSFTPFLSLSHAYQGKRAADVKNSFWLPSYHLVNTRAGIRWKNWETSIFVQNLTDERPEISGVQFGPGTNVVNYGRGRVTGLALSAKF